MLLLKKKSFWIFATLLIISGKMFYFSFADKVSIDKIKSNTPKLSISIVPPPPQLNVGAYVLFDYNSGQVIAEQNMHKRLPPASLTKMMTAYVVEHMLVDGQFTQNDKVLISKNAWKTGGSTMFIEVGEKVSVENLLKGLIVVSGNDAAVALAEYVAGSEDGFVQLMNTTAKQMGLKNTNFEDANGLPGDHHYSSAYDLAKIAWHIIHDYPQYYKYYSLKEFQHGTDKKTGKLLAPQDNRITLLWSDKHVDGLKTGHTDAAGYCLTVSSRQDGRRLIAVILKSSSSKSRDIDAQKLLSYGYRFYSDINPVKAGTLKTVRIWKGKTAELPVGIESDIWVTVPKSESSKVTTSITLHKTITAPVNKGEKIGDIQILLNDKVLKTTPVIAEKTIGKSGFFRRIWDSIRLFLHNLF